MKLTATMRQLRERRGDGFPGERPRAGRDDRPGPPDDGGDRPPRRRDGGGAGERFRPLQNPGPPPQPEEQRGYRGPEGERGPRDQREFGVRGPERMGPPNPERLFKAFDANGDDQLSREEFMQLTKAVHERMAAMRGRGFRPRPPDDGGQGRGQFRGPEGPDGPRPPRPPRPEFESVEPPEPAAADNSA
jgi:23S rRNA pseudouridine2604 synthase